MQNFRRRLPLVHFLSKRLGLPAAQTRGALGRLWQASPHPPTPQSVPAGGRRAPGSGFSDLWFCTSDLESVPADTITVAMTRYRPSFDQFCKRTPENRKTMKIINFHNFRLVFLLICTSNTHSN